MTSKKGTGEAAAAANQPAYEIVASVQTDKGCVREINEDSGRLVRPNDARLLEERGLLLVVADGMGGHSAGEVASQMAVDLISRLYYQSQGDALAALRDAVSEANRRIFSAAAADESKRGMGTTCTALAIRGGEATVAHVGDSRCYMVRGGDIYQLTEDHSAVMEMVRHGLISKEEARTHEDKNVILRALGTTPEVEVAMAEPFAVREGDRLLLCSDGLHDLVTDEEIGQTLAGADDLHAAGQQLIELAKGRGGHDNITVGIVGVVPPGTVADEAKDAPATREVEAVK
ncbi:MAG TPA: Stp1/IreP family PP2C-type Ser/Thr phosphatase [Pyrinomonadaceae bacterium]|nr:Stp1/IreP family PP2C-type Ser/Thr phosphatase [Pyrinomonadaceae bacterium]